jgi:hypothetical protein
MLLGICEFRQKRCREGRAFVMGVNEQYGILEVKNALWKSVYYVQRSNICSVVYVSVLTKL